MGPLGLAGSMSPPQHPSPPTKMVQMPPECIFVFFCVWVCVAAVCNISHVVGAFFLLEKIKLNCVSLFVTLSLPLSSQSWKFSAMLRRGPVGTDPCLTMLRMLALTVCMFLVVRLGLL